MGLRQGLAHAAFHAGEVMHIALKGGIERLPAGKMAATHDPLLLQRSEVAIHRGQPHGLILLSQQAMQSLAAEFCFAALEQAENLLLAGGEA